MSAVVVDVDRILFEEATGDSMTDMIEVLLEERAENVVITAISVDERVEEVVICVLRTVLVLFGKRAEEVANSAPENKRLPKADGRVDFVMVVEETVDGQPMQKMRQDVSLQ